MRRLVSIVCFLYLLLLVPAITLAQPPVEPPEGDEEDLEAEEDEEEEPTLRPPTVEPLDVSLAQEEEDEEEEVDEEELPDPDEAMQQLEDGAPPSSDPTRATWGAPQPTLTLHGYYRVRPQLWDTFFLGRGVNNDGTRDSAPVAPFSNFVPTTRLGSVSGGCGDMVGPGMSSSCPTNGTLAFANMRLRVEPTIALSDDVKVHLQLDFLDNLVLGSTPDGLLVTPDPTSGSGFVRNARTPRVPLDSFAATQISPSAYRNSLNDAIRVRRAWAEVTNRGLGSLRFGRMGSAWGLGMLANSGDGIDSDFQSDVDRIMAITKLAGFYLIAAWDFASEGIVEQYGLDLQQLPYDVDQTDDVNQWVFAAARRSTEEEQKEALQRGDFVLNGGAYFVYRNQNNTTAGIGNPFARPSETSSFVAVRRHAEAFIPDIWAQFLWGSLRIEFEAALIAGSIQNIENDSFVQSDYQLLQGGAVLEMEYHMLEDQLGIYFNAGYASGDADVDGLAITGGLPPQRPAAGVTDNTISTFYIHPNYRIDLILWRNIMTQIGGAYYIKPGLSYDFIKNAFGQLLGARADLIYSVASETRQTWGNDPNLGVEINGSLYYRSEDGPEIFDGFYANLQYGILFPLAGLGYLPTDASHTNVSLQNAQIVRLILGVQY